MSDPSRRSKLIQEFEKDFVPDYDALNMPSADKRAAYALEHIAFRVGHLEKHLNRIAGAIETLMSRPLGAVANAEPQRLLRFLRVEKLARLP
jgi:hypothetical protein